MNRMLRSALVLAFVVVGIGCGGGSMDAPAAPDVELSSRNPAAHIVCDAEDPCPKGYLCLGHIRCAKVCKTDTDCPTGQTCSGSLGGKNFCQ